MKRLFIFLIIFSGVYILKGQEQNIKSSEDSKEDKTGTNPANLSSSFLITNDYQVLKGGDNYSNNLKISLSKPFFNKKLSTKFTTPFLSSNLKGETLGGLGNLSLKLTYIAYLSKKYATILASEFEFDTTTEKLLRTNKNDIKFSVIQVFFLGTKDILAPSYQHSLSLSNTSIYKSTNIGTFDLYYVSKIKNGKSWVKIDPSYIFDFANNIDYGVLKVEYGEVISNGFSYGINPGIGFGGKRSVDYTLGINFKFVF